ncbi:MAG: lytic murein transglycosylase [Candidatus Pacebacteria bacterium]|nr:lytic murein transglycosylase [Candidatus Paceibacterota bacterium]
MTKYSLQKRYSFTKNATIFVLLGLFIFFIITPTIVLALTPEERTKLEAELAQLELEIKEKEALLSQQKKQTGSIKNDIDVLTSEIEKTRLDIKAKALLITKLSNEISTKEVVIETLEEKARREKDSLRRLLQKTNEYNDLSLIHMIASKDRLSDFYGDLDVYESIRNEIKVSLEEIRTVQGKTLDEKATLENKQNQEVDTKVLLEQNKKKVEANEDEKQKLLSVSKNKESEYQKIVAERQKKAAAIRAALFSFRDSGAIPFGDALTYAEQASTVTGVRPAFVLAILKQETNLGANIGSCYLKNTQTGAGVGKNTGTPFLKVMKPDRDVQPFLALTTALGLDPFTTPVSCPWAGGGWGGAVGASQFIPSTWDLMKNKVASSLGIAIASPWVPQHAIMASSMYLDDLGAGVGGYTAERNAACRYYSGSVCTPGRSPANVFYGDQVMAKTAEIQANIDILQNL